ncbi:hypothetical protein EDD18DRAFT_1116454 [Armillaria luteobubalina]|uniref:Uncharacterized protein n=1 Tax=Armillaria luteobubalina TaxID=153913 RepID=A0AA39U5D5_9AGAR|nr:hypothetical protein EDD18DRAFT_1116454 [Armillaria luteobubalina]
MLSTLRLWPGTAVATMCRGCKTHRKDFGLEGKQGRRGYAIVLVGRTRSRGWDLASRCGAWFVRCVHLGYGNGAVQQRRFDMELGSITTATHASSNPTCATTPSRALKHPRPSTNADLRSLSHTAVSLTLLPIPPEDERPARGRNGKREDGESGARTGWTSVHAWSGGVVVLLLDGRWGGGC